MSRPQSMSESLPTLRAFVARVRPHLGRQKHVIGGSMLALFAEVVLRVMEPWPLKVIIDNVLELPSARSSRLPLLDTVEPSLLLPLAAAALVVFAGLRALAAYTTAVGFALAGNRVLNEVRNELFERLQALSLRFHHRARTGDLIVRVMGDVGMLKEVAVTAFLPLVGNVLVMTVMVTVMAWLNWQLTLVVVAMVPLLALVARRRSRRIQSVARGQRKREGALATTAAESIGSIHVVQALSLGSVFGGTFSRDSRRSLREGVKAKRLTAGLERSVDLMIAVATAVTLWLGARAVLDGSLTPGELLVFLAYLKSSFKPVRNFAKYTGRLAKASAAAERVVEVLDEEPEIVDAADAVEAPAFVGDVRFDNVDFEYSPGRPALERISFEVRSGQTVALVGRSGSGKSTLANLLLRLYDPGAGRVLIDGQDIRQWTVESLRRQISVVLQDSLLFSGTIAENIAHGRREAEMEEIVGAARSADAHGFIERLADGYDTVVGERGVTLSAGQRQRVAIARAAIRRAPILILDEPTTGLDRRSQRQVTRALRSLTATSATLLVTHDLEQARVADWIVFIESGRLVEQGRHDELIEARGPYAALFGAAPADGHRKANHVA